ncbi:MAG: hypothetical protein WBE89_14690 [Methyloceanibacter sp.]
MPFASTVGLGVSTFIDTDFLDDRLDYLCVATLQSLSSGRALT